MPSLIDGKYKVVRLLGEGGMGAVFEARHMGTGRRVALKVMIPEVLAHGGDLIARFQREARAAGAIESPHIAQVLDSGIDRETQSPFMVMEMLSGEDVGQAIERLGPLPPDLAVRIVAQACVGLAKAHEAHVVHRDIKPANLFLATQDDGSVVLKLLDFGIAKVKPDQMASGEAAKLTSTGSLMGSPLYMSPEQVRGLRQIDARTDLWSLGVVLYEALCGSTPHGHHEALGAIMIAICGEAAPPIQERAPWVSPALASVVHRALSLDPVQRFASANEMLAALRTLLPNGHTIDVRMLTGVPQEARSHAPAPRPPTLQPHELATLAATTTTYRDLSQPARTVSITAGPPNRKPLLFVAAGSLLLLLIAAAGVAKVRGLAFATHTTAEEPPASSIASAASTASTAGKASAPRDDVTSPPPPSERAAQPPPVSDASSVAASAVPSAVPAAAGPLRPKGPKPAVATSAAPPAVPSQAAVTPAPPVTTAPTPRAPSCEPPYTINAAGHHVLKPECQ